MELCAARGYKIQNPDVLPTSANPPFLFKGTWKVYWGDHEFNGEDVQ